MGVQPAEYKGWRTDPRRYLAHRSASGRVGWLRWLVLALLAMWAVGWFVVFSRQGGYSWHYFRDSAAALFGPDGLHLYARHPELQFGPIAPVVAGAIGAVAGSSVLPAQLVMVGLGVGAIALVRTLAVGELSGWSVRQIDTTLVMATFILTPAWMLLSVGVGHLDDALALVLMLAGLVAVRRDHAVSAGALLSLSAVAKPWALPFVVFILLLSRQSRVRAVVAYVGTQLACWLPFVIADTATFRLTQFKIPIQQGSVLAMLGMQGGTPSWDRPAQLLLGVGVAWWVLRRGHWAAVPLMVVLTRLVLDPGAHSYYAAGAVAAALLWDTVGAQRTWPLWTCGTGLLIFLTAQVPEADQVRGPALLAITAVAVWLFCWQRPSVDTRSPALSVTGQMMASGRP